MGRVFRNWKLVNFGLDIFILFFLLAETWIELPTLGVLLGRTHPLLLHFPIVFVCLIPILPLLLLKLEAKEATLWVERYLEIVHFFCAMTIILGLFLSQESGYGAGSVDWHKWFSIAVLCGVIGLQYYYKRWYQLRQWWWFSFVVVALLMVTGHLGANLTHGSDFITQPLGIKNKKKVAFEDTDLFQDVVFSIIDQKCISCHNTEKSKGDLVLTDSVGFQKGGENGSAIVPGDVSESLLIQRLLLNINHDDHMPPKGKMQLTSDEIELLEAWVKTGAPFHQRTMDLSKSDTLYQLAESVYGYEDSKDGFDFSAASERSIQQLNDNYRMLAPVSQGSPALYGRFLSKHHFSNSQIKDLGSVAQQLVDLNLSNMPVTDSELNMISNFKQLQVLNLNFSLITDLGLSQLSVLEHLNVLSLIGTPISIVGVEKLLEKKTNLKRLYLWNTKVNEEELASLAIDNPRIEIIGRSNPFGDQIIALNQPMVEPDRTFFLDTMKVVVRHPIKDVEIRYTSDGSEPDSLLSALYSTEILLEENADLRFKAFKIGWKSSSSVGRSFYRSVYSPDTSWLENSPHRNYLGEGILSMVDLKAGDLDRRNKAYLGYRNESFKSVYGFSESVALQSIAISGAYIPGSYIFPPKEIIVYGKNPEGVFVKIKSQMVAMPNSKKPNGKYFESILLDGMTIPEVKIEVVPHSKLPRWHQASGESAWIFIDEILFK